MSNGERPFRIALTSDLHYDCNTGFSGQIETGVLKRILESMFNDLKKENFDIIVLAGDIISHTQHQWKPILKLIREYFPDDTILAVMGNHDYWQEKIELSIKQTIEHQRRMLNEYNIIYLSDMPYVDDGITVYGFDGWYGSTHPPSNDQYHMPKFADKMDVNTFLFERSEELLNNIPDKSTDDPEYKVVIVTHFELNDESMGGPFQWLDIIRDKADLLLVGHSHRSCDKILSGYGGLRMVNCGSDYYYPRYKIVEV